MAKIGLEVRLARTAEEKEIVFGLVYGVYCEEFGYLDKKNYPSKKAHDKYDFLETTRNFLAIDTGNAIGSIRLIGENQYGLPIEEFYSLPKSNRGKKEDMEIGRFVILPDARKSLIAVNLLKIAYLFAKKEGISNLFFMASLDEVKTYEKFGGKTFDAEKYNHHVHRSVMPMLWKLAETEEPYNAFFNRPDKRIIF